MLWNVWIFLALTTLCLPTLANKPVHHGIDLTAMDTHISPCRDFYHYANGTWLKHTTIPAIHADWDSFAQVYDNNLPVLRIIAERAAADPTATPGSPAGKVGSLYRSGMNTARIEADGVKPLFEKFEQIDGIQDAPSLLKELGRLHRIEVGAAFTFSISQDDKQSTQEVAHLDQGGLGLPERGFYTRTDTESQAIRDAYVAHIARMFVLSGESRTRANAYAQIVLMLETQLALASMTPVEQRDPQAIYHKMTLVDLNALVPGTDWQPYFTALGLAHPGSFIVGQPVFFTTLGKMLTSLPIADWRIYLRWNLLTQESQRLNKALDTENFHFYSTVLNGTPRQQARWKRVLASVDEALGEDLGRLYVAQAFSPLAKSKATALVFNLKAVLREDIAHLAWMSPETRAKAQEKLDAMVVKIGYPDHWRDYSGLDVSSPSYVVNSMRADEFEFQRNLYKIGRPVDRGEWGMTPPTVNAYYDSEMNDINFPAGILQPPFFDPEADDAFNYGAIGAVIGHEMTHGFDDEGRQYDSAGNLHDWWTPTDAENFAARAAQITAQYSAYEPLPGKHIDGRLTTGENIADIGGLKIAYLALEKSLQGKPRTKIDGFTPEQRFFIAFAQMYHDKIRPEIARVLLTSDTHSPDEYRVIGALADTPEFREAFGCPPDPKSDLLTLW